MEWLQKRSNLLVLVAGTVLWGIIILVVWLVT
jgi:hypothetical protein